MEEIKINDYIRTKKGTIAKVLAYQDLTTYDDKRISVTFHSFDTDKGAIADVEIEKHSKNIIDLIEVGDYVNGKLIHKIDKRPNYCYLYYGNCKTFVDYQIKNIVTRERFARESYKVEEGQDV